MSIIGAGSVLFWVGTGSTGLTTGGVTGWVVLSLGAGSVLVVLDVILSEALLLSTRDLIEAAIFENLLNSGSYLVPTLSSLKI